jgi:hypothetical protein
MPILRFRWRQNESSGFYRADAWACKQPKQEQKESSAQVVPLPRRARAQQAAEDQAQIERSHMDQLPL